jgi:hypothetical protein
MKVFFTLFFLIAFSTPDFCQHIISYKVNHKIPVMQNPNGKVLVNVTKNKILTVYDYDHHHDCFMVKYKENYGIIEPERWVTDACWKQLRGKVPPSDSTVKLVARKFLVEQINKFSPELSAGSEKKRVAMVQKYGYTDGLNIASGKIWLGMTTKMALDSWGIPYRVTRNIGNWGIQEQWTYSNGYLYFHNGVLSEIFRIK